jgi:hypothetical protein
VTYYGIQKWNGGGGGQSPQTALITYYSFLSDFWLID